MTAVAIIVPVLRRPHRVAPLLESIEAATPEPHRVLFVCSPGDTDEQDAVHAAGANMLVLDQDVAPGDWARKINAGYRATTEPWLLCGADDLAFHHGWFSQALEHAADGIGVIGTNDLGNPSVIKGLHSTHPLVARWYADQWGTVDRPGTVAHEAYPHEYVDVELVETAKVRKAWAFAGDSKVEHLHPHWGKAPTDELYDAHAERMRAGATLWQKRRQLVRRTARRPHQLPAERPGVTILTAGLPHRAGLLAEANASVAAQTVGTAHLIGVDAGQGVAAVRNQLLAAATTEWVGFLDDDDLLDPHHVETLLAHSAGADVVIPHCRFDGPPLPPQFCNRTFTRSDLRRHGVFPITVLARRQAVLAAGAFRAEDQWEDWALWNRMADAGARFTVVPETTWTYRTAGADRRTDLLHGVLA